MAPVLTLPAVPTIKNGRSPAARSSSIERLSAAGSTRCSASVAPAQAVAGWLADTLGARSETVVLGVIFAAGLGAAPLALLGGAAAATAWVTSHAGPWRRIAASYVYALVPLGFGVWLAHYGFHLLTGMLTIVPVTQSAVIDLTGRSLLGEPLWRWTGLQPGAVLPIEVGVIVLGTCGSLGLAYLVSERDHPERAVAATVPWAVVTLLLTAAALWIGAQPMAMRGVGLAG
jgi:hypothetical protein